jgi:tight adherence protein B
VRERCARGALSMIAAFMLALVGTAGGAVAQTVPLELSVDASAYPEVAVTFAVPPAAGGRTLGADAFALIENGARRPAEATPLAGDSLDVVLAIDTSGSMAGAPLVAAKGAAASFLARMPAATRVAVVGFGPAPLVASPFTLDRAALTAAVNGLVARGETALYDAVGLAVDQFGAGPARRAVVVLSDGADTVSRASLDGVASRLASAGARVDVVELASADANSAALARLAAAGAGRVVPAGDPAALAGIFDGIAATLASQYRLVYRSEAAGRAEVAVLLAHAGVTAEGRAIADLPLAPAPAPAPAAPVPTTPAAAVATWMLLAGAGAVFLALVIGTLAASRPSARRQRAARRARLGMGGLADADPVTAVTRLAVRATEAADAAIQRRGARSALNRALEEAGLALRPAEFVVVVGSAAATGLLLGLLLSGPVLGLVLVMLMPVVARLLLRARADRRRAQFADQLGDVLQLLSGSLRAGYGLLQALDAVAVEGEPPSSEEFRRLVVEAQLGRDLSEALRASADRMASDDFGWVVGAIEIHREVGGDLADVLDNVAATIRERAQLRRQVRALSAEGRISAYILVALPVLMALVLQLINPGYLTPLTRGGGLVLAGVGVGLMVLGSLWLKRICRLVY